MKKILIVVSVIVALIIIATLLSPKARDSASDGFNQGIGGQ